MEEQRSNRIFGLDLLRTIAILIVVLQHSLPLVSAHYAFLEHLTLPDGVDLFFVLSGFLIGGQLILKIESNQKFRFKELNTFLKRRWWRTLPNYFLFLGINIVLIYFSFIKGEINTYLLSYFCFLQNFFKPLDFLFWESWSLSVEEWFYLSYSFLLWMLFKIKTPFTIKHKILFSILLFITLPLFYRYFSLSYLPEYLDWDLYYRKLVPARLDAMGYGVLAALLHQYFFTNWNSKKNLLFVTGIAGIFLISYFHTELMMNFAFARTLYFNVNALLVMFLLPKLNSLKTEPFLFTPFEFISRISYSVYLLHIPLFQLFETNTTVNSELGNIIRYMVYLATTIFFSFLIYHYFEKPLMNFGRRSD